jgi:hypothetical protein
MSDTPIDQMSPQEATAWLEQKSAAYESGKAPTDKPSNATEARARLDHLTADKAWSERYLKGGVAENREFKALTQMVADAKPGDRLEAVLAGQRHNNTMVETVSGDELSTSKLAVAVDGLREAGVADPDVLRQAINGFPVSRAEVAATQQLKAQRLGDAAWLQRYLGGGTVERREMTLINIILTSTIADA